MGGRLSSVPSRRAFTQYINIDTFLRAKHSSGWNSTLSDTYLRISGVRSSTSSRVDKPLSDIYLRTMRRTERSVTALCFRKSRIFVRMFLYSSEFLNSSDNLL